MIAASLAAPISNAVLLKKASPLFPNNPGVHCLYRWATKGVRGVVLETTIVGGRRYVEREAVAAFLLALNTAKPQESTSGETVNRLPREPRLSKAEREKRDARLDEYYSRKAKAENQAAREALR